MEAARIEPGRKHCGGLPMTVMHVDGYETATLRFGALEPGARGQGPLAENLDMWAEVFACRPAPFLTKRSSEHLAGNVRVTPFNSFERVEDYFRRRPNLRDCYSYSPNYPYAAGGVYSKARA